MLERDIPADGIGVRGSMKLKHLERMLEKQRQVGGGSDSPRNLTVTSFAIDAGGGAIGREVEVMIVGVAPLLEDGQWNLYCITTDVEPKKNRFSVVGEGLEIKYNPVSRHGTAQPWRVPGCRDNAANQELVKRLS